MGAEGAVQVVFKRELEAATDPKARAAELIDQYRRDFASPYQAAEHDMITDVIAPSETRTKVSMALRVLLTQTTDPPTQKTWTDSIMSITNSFAVVVAAAKDTTIVQDTVAVVAQNAAAVVTDVVGKGGFEAKGNLRAADRISVHRLAGGVRRAGWV